MTIRPLWLVYAALALIVAVPVGALLFAWAGVYDVAASTGHYKITDYFLRFGMENSVKARAPDVQPPPLDDPNLIRLGAGHFHSGCAYCHGAPGTLISPIAQRMLPPPPDLAQRLGEWTDQDLFRLIKHGLKYTGMPAWPARSGSRLIISGVGRQPRPLGLAGNDSFALEVERLFLADPHAVAQRAALWQHEISVSCRGIDNDGAGVLVR